VGRTPKTPQGNGHQEWLDNSAHQCTVRCCDIGWGYTSIRPRWTDERTSDFYQMTTIVRHEQLWLAPSDYGQNQRQFLYGRNCGETSNLRLFLATNASLRKSARSRTGGARPFDRPPRPQTEQHSDHGQRPTAHQSPSGCSENTQISRTTGEREQGNREDDADRKTHDGRDAGRSLSEQTSQQHR